MTELRYDVLVHDGLPRRREQRLPDGSAIVSSPVTSTLIFGDHDAVLVDPPFTHDQIARTGDWIEAAGRTLTHVYATHGHGDHWLGTDNLLQRFPGVIAYATPGAIAKMREQAVHHDRVTHRAESGEGDVPNMPEAGPEPELFPYGEGRRGHGSPLRR